MENTGDLPVLIAQSGPLNGQRWMLRAELVIGRDPGCAVVVADRQVSRYHARFTPREDGVLLEDRGSKNGTYVNGRLLQEPCLLQDGDLVQVALVQAIVFLSSDSTMPLPPSPRAAAGSGACRLALDVRARRVWVCGEELLPPLSLPQFRLLEVLYEQQGKVVERQKLVETVWNEEEAEGVSEEALDALVRRLRDRLALVDPTHAYIITVRGHGLRLENPDH
jgi:pSer/pThr/pTyr-binding forkhead associated (FHA) protein